jgi:hypothetical protein
MPYRTLMLEVSVADKFFFMRLLVLFSLYVISSIWDCLVCQFFGLCERLIIGNFFLRFVTGVAHWHGLRPDIHKAGERKDGEDDNPHSRKMHIMFNPTKKGVAASRLDAFEFIDVLQRKHEEAGLKSPDEDLILLLMEAGAKLQSSKWLTGVTGALIVPPPLLGLRNEDVAMKISNAVSFRTEGSGRRTSFNEKFAPLMTDAPPSDINLSSGQSYPTPALDGAAVALRLETFGNLPAQDPSLMDPWAANLDLSLNLWLCADGIDIVEEVEASIPASLRVPTPLEPEEAARFAAVWMDISFQQKFFQAYSSQITRLDWETKVARVKQSATIPKDLSKRCRSFEWYAREVNPDLTKILEQGGWESHHKEMEEKKFGKMVDTEEKKARKIEQLPPAERKEENVKETPKDPPEKAEKNEEPAKETPKEAPQKAAEKVEENNADKQAENEIPKEALKEEQKDAPQKKVAEKVEESNADKQAANEEPKKEVVKEGQNEAPPKAAEKAEENITGKKADNKDNKNESDAIPNLAREDKMIKPRKKLRKENLKIITTAKPVELAFQDVSGEHKEHPHMGAQDGNGNWGYIHDETALRKNPPKWNFSEEMTKEACTSRDNNYKMMRERIYVDTLYEEKMKDTPNRAKIFCLVYTTEKGHGRIPHIRQTWG